MSWGDRKRVVFEDDPDVVTRFASVARTEGLSVSAACRRAIREWLDERDRPAEGAPR